MWELKRAEQVRLNRILTEYGRDKMPHPEQIRFDVAWLVNVMVRLNDAYVVEKARNKIRQESE